MRTSTPKTIKFKKLKHRLGLPQYAAIGLLESLWLFTQANAQLGDIGRHSNKDIASGIDWEGDPDRLIEELIYCGWIDACPEKRLLIHDWDAESYGRGEPTKRPDLSTTTWKRLRISIIEDRGAFCEYCGCDCSSDPTVDHVRPVSRGGELFEPSNLVVACRPCNSRKGASLVAFCPLKEGATS